ncbi:ABC transporter permease [Alicyclobacillus acidoterrestris]|nr:ABC transporter permease [Alicyclobacillus acidoterrestris]
METQSSESAAVYASVTSKRDRARAKQSFAAYGFMTPWMLGMMFLTLGSVLFSVYLAFTNSNLLSPAHWNGIENFKQIFTADPNFVASIRATFLYVLVSVPCRLVFALLVAVLLNRNVRGLGIYRAVYYLPSLVGGSVGVSIGWRELFSPNGTINLLLKHVGINGPSWLANPVGAFFVLVLLSVWQFGSEMVIFLAGLKQIPQTYYEAASIDGASKFQKFFKVTLPMLSPIVFFNLVMGTINAFMVFTQVYVITGGGPMNSTLFYVLYVYQQAFTYFHMGYAAALSIILLFMIAACTGLLFLTSKYWVKYEN